MALASYKSAKSVVQLSESPVFHYQYSSITDAVSNLARTDSEPKIAEGAKRTASQSKKGAERLFLSFAKESYLPSRCEKGVGRKGGEKQVKRVEYKVLRKAQTVKRARCKAEKQE